MQLSKPLSIIEIGFGNGHFAVWAKDQGWNVVGTEIDCELIAQAVASGIEAHGGEQPIDQIAKWTVL